MKSITIIACVLGVSGATASAEATKGADYLGQLSNCNPSCYSPAPAEQVKSATERTVCGYLDYTIVQEAPRGTSKWTPARIRGVPAAQPTELPKCTLPANSRGKWASVIAQAKGDLPGVEKGDRLVVPPGEAWEVKPSEDDLKTQYRTVTLRVYSKSYKLRPNFCGTTAANMVCEFSSEGRAAALAINEARVRLDEAKQLQAAGKLEGCRIASWDAVRIDKALGRFRTKAIANKEWVKGRVYRTRADGDLDEKSLFDKLAGIAKEAEGLYGGCKGGKIDVSDAEADRYF